MQHPEGTISMSSQQADPATECGVGSRHPAGRRISTETRWAYMTSELTRLVLAVSGVLIASAVADATDYGIQEAWFHISLLTTGYLVSRGLAKSRSREFYDDDRDVGDRSKLNRDHRRSEPSAQSPARPVSPVPEELQGGRRP